jgi:2-keto-4-pentenoate hydratase
MYLSINGEVVSRGAGRECMGNPLRAALWLARTMARHNTPLMPGQLIMTGALGPMVDLRSNGTFARDVSCQITGLESVRCTFVSEATS